MLGRLLDAAIADASYTDVHDRAMLYYRLLQHDVAAAEAIICNSDTVGGQFVEEVPSELQDRIFEEFNTLSVIYGQPSERFLLESARKARPVEETAGGANGAAEEESEEESDEEEAPAPAPPPAVANGNHTGGGMDLLGLDEALPSAPRTAPPFALEASATLEPAAFQQQWGGLPTADSWQHQTTLSVPLEQLSARFAARFVKTMAFGAVGDAAKFYFFARPAGSTSGILLLELVVSKSSGVASATLKAGGGGEAGARPFSALVREMLSS